MRFKLALALCTLPVPATAALTPAEQKMSSTVDAEYERTVGLLEKLVNVNSGSLNIEGVTEVGRMMRAELEPLGFQVRWVPMTDVKRAGHIVAVHKGNGRGKRMLLIGHLDTVFEKDAPFQTFVRKGDKAEGPGADDDKGGMVVIVSAFFPGIIEKWVPALFGLVFTDDGLFILRICLYCWIPLSMVGAWIARDIEKTAIGRVLSPALVYFVGYGSLLCAITFDSYIKELRGAEAKWDKTEKTGRVAS